MKIFAVGMNYIQHNKELDGALYKPENPVIFTKCDSALLKDRKPFFIPDWSKQVDYGGEDMSSWKEYSREIRSQILRRCYRGHRLHGKGHTETYARKRYAVGPL